MNAFSHFARALRNRVVALSPSCKEAARLQSEALDHPLPVLKRCGLRFHLILCKWCRRYGEQVEFLHAAAKHLPEHEPDASPAALSAEARDRIRRRLQSEIKP